MKAQAFIVGALAFGVAVACGSSDPERNPYLANPGHDAGRQDSATNDSAATNDARPDSPGADAPGDARGDAAADGGADADLPDAPVADQAHPDVAPDAHVASCAQDLSASQRALIGVSTAKEERFGSISDDELTLAFSVADGGPVEVFVAERQQKDEAFQTPVRLTGDFALDRAALTPDGLSLIVVNRDLQGFTHFARDARDQAFELASSSQYDAIVAGLGTGESLGDPVFALGGQVLLFSQYGGGRMDTVMFANRLSNGSAFDVGGALTNPELRRQGAARRRPTGVSSDYTTLFFYDEASGTSKAGSFSGGFTFSAVTELGAVSGAQPNADCSAFYFDAQGQSSRDLFSAR
jgi:hypothetical protein